MPSPKQVSPLLQQSPVCGLSGTSSGRPAVQSGGPNKPQNLIAKFRHGPTRAVISGFWRLVLLACVDLHHERRDGTFSASGMCARYSAALDKPSNYMPIPYTHFSLGSAAFWMAVLKCTATSENLPYPLQNGVGMRAT